MKNLSSRNWPVLIVGGGVVGCALAREFTLAQVPTLLIEKGRDILSGASKANSSILHTGFDVKPNALELHCIQVGRQEFSRIKDELNLPILHTSAVLLAKSKSELDELPEHKKLAIKNGVEGVSILSREAVHKQFPWINKQVLGGMLVGGEDVIDPWSTPLAYAQQAILNGALFQRSCKVHDGVLENGVWKIETSRGPVRATTVINASGVQGDKVEQIRGASPFTIKPRKGQFVVFDKYASSVVNTIVLPVPTEKSKGVLIAPTIFGNVIAGPTAEEQDNRDDTSVDRVTLNGLVEYARNLVPALKHCPVTASYAGIRPATQFQDYQIHSYPNQQWISVSGIRSTGLSAALGIAKFVAGIYDQQFEPLTQLDNFHSVMMPNLAEHLPRPYQAGSSGEIVCHCERVTRGEIERALNTTLPAVDIGGLKRRTRCLMGRCQGFYCASRILQLTADSIYWPTTSPTE